MIIKFFIAFFCFCAIGAVWGWREMRDIEDEMMFHDEDIWDDDDN